MTRKLYWEDSHQTRFEATVVSVEEREGARWVALDRTAFYPTAGGQPGDRGRLGGLDVVEVEITEDERILHRVAGDQALTPGARVEGEIDWARRQEMMQQHTGQHILSQAFFQLFGAETQGFRITDRGSEIDLAFDAEPAAVEQAIARAESLANQVVFENREIRVHEVTPEEAAKLPLRKESFIADCIRVIEIEEYDWSPCGGTHARRTGEVGLIAVTSWERAKRLTRVHFAAGTRALAELHSAGRTADGIARRLSVGRDEAESSVGKLQEENKRLSRRVRELAEIAAEVEARELIASVGLSDRVRIIARVFPDRDFEEIKLLAHRLVEGEGVIALLATREETVVRLVFARSAVLHGHPNADMNALMRRACDRLGGRGGGKPDFAQGGGSRVEDADAALQALRAALLEEFA